MNVYKFDRSYGSSVESMKRAAQLIADRTPKIVVFSASKETVIHLERIAACFFTRDIDQAHEEITKLEFSFANFANNLITNDTIKQQAITYILDHFHCIWNYTKKSFTSSDEKEIVAQGELISSALLSFYLQEQEINNVLLSAFDFMRVGIDGKTEIEYMEQKLNEQFNKHKNQSLFITQGGICRNVYDEADLFRQGEGDYTASLIGACIEAKEIRIWQDDSKTNAADTHITGDAHAMNQLSFEEAEYLSLFSTQILNPLYIAPARAKGIPVRLLHSLETAEEGIVISNHQENSGIKAIADKDGVIYIKFESNHALRPYLFISKILETFAKYQLSFCTLTSSSSNVSVAIDNKESLSHTLSELARYAYIKVEDKMSIISVVGNMKWQHTGLETKILNALKEIPLRMISYGSNNTNLSLVIKDSDKKKALQSLNQSLFVHTAILGSCYQSLQV